MLNRFSKDIGFLDDILIYTFCEFLQVSQICNLEIIFYNFLKLFSRFFAILITAVIANYYLVIVIFILCIVFLLFRWYYLRMARKIKRIEALSELICTLFITPSLAPLYSYLLTPSLSSSLILSSFLLSFG